MLGRIIWKNSVPIMLGVGVLVYGYTLYTTPTPCAEPIEYRIGVLDPRFGVSEAKLLADLEQASSVWEEAQGGTDLFVYNPNAALTVSLLYDERQEITQQEKALASKIHEGTLSAEAAMQEYRALRATYAAASAAYLSDAAAFKKAHDAYNARVVAYNKHGGSAQEYAALQSDKVSLEEKTQTLESQRKKVNQLAADANALISQYNLLVERVNDHVDTINNDGLAGTQFEEGIYISDEAGQRIEIYQFDDQTTFVRVLAHELGHALGLGHNEGVDSIMNPVNRGSNLTATEEDSLALKTLCGVK